MKKCLIKQPAGLGDIILCQKIVDALILEGYQVWWPVIDHYYSCLQEHMQREGLIFCLQSEDFPMKDCFSSDIIRPVKYRDTEHLYFPLHCADLSFPGESALKAKYKILGLDCSGWQQSFVFQRNIERENELFYDVLDLKDNMSYSFINAWYGSPPGVSKKEFSVAGTARCVEMEIMDGFTIFDWCKVIENASQIHCVDTSLFYIIEMLQLKAEKLKAYSKFEPANYMHIDGLFAKSWDYGL